MYCRKKNWFTTVDYFSPFNITVLISIETPRVSNNSIHWVPKSIRQALLCPHVPLPLVCCVQNLLTEAFSPLPLQLTNGFKSFGKVEIRAAVASWVHIIYTLVHRQRATLLTWSFSGVLRMPTPDLVPTQYPEMQHTRQATDQMLAPILRCRILRVGILFDLSDLISATLTIRLHNTYLNHRHSKLSV